MPITIRTQPIDGETWPQVTTTNSEDALRATVGFKSGKLMQSSFDTDKAAFTSSTHGLVDTAIAAWNNHHHLVLRPDDVWLAITSQLGFFINGHAEELRHLFVSHEGQKSLHITQYAHPDQADYASFATQMAEEMRKQVIDPDLVPWIIPDFSTTTDTDRVVGSVLLMGAMKSYFEYNFLCSTCGIPSVTLLGERSDWEKLQTRVEKIARLGGEALEFHRLLEPIARHMVLSFDHPTSDAVLKFWRIIASRERPRYRMSGGPSEYVSGWVTTFCFWRADGSRNQFYHGTDSVHDIDGVRYFRCNQTTRCAVGQKSPSRPSGSTMGWSWKSATAAWLQGRSAWSQASTWTSA